VVGGTANDFSDVTIRRQSCVKYDIKQLDVLVRAMATSIPPDSGNFCRWTRVPNKTASVLAVVYRRYTDRGGDYVQ